NYRFPALPPGTYNLQFELPGFNTLKREGIQIAMGFTAAVNVELSVASLQETVTVTGDSPVIDTSNTRVQQNFKLEALQQIPNSRDLWSLLAVTPAVTMGRIDVGGNRAGTQTGYTAYGFSGQNRVLVEGINTTEGTSGAGFYVDYGSFEEVFLGTVEQGAEMPTPGVQSQMLGKSGGNKFQGEIYQDFETNSMISENIENNLPSKLLFSLTNGGGTRLHSNDKQKYRDSNINVGATLAQLSGSWIYKGEWNGTLSNKLYAEARYGVFGYYFPLIANTDSNEFQTVNAQLSLYTGADQKEQLDRQRKQATGSLT